jgi:proteasome accessory factor B
MGKRYTRVHRLLQIISLLQSKRGLKPCDLARLCETHIRTIYRDIDSINAAGIPCGMDKESEGYTIGRGYFMPPVDLTADEAMALVALAEQVSRPANIPFMRTAIRAVEKIRSQLPAKLIDAIGPLDDRVQVALARTMADDSPREVYDRIRTAIATKRAVRCRYERNKLDPGNDDSKPFLFMPYLLWYCQRAWYAVGRRSDRKGVRQLKLNRFTSITLTDNPYAIADDFTLESHLGNAWRMIRGDTTHRVVVRFHQPYAETASETQWHPTQQEEWSDDMQTLTLRFTVDGLDEIVWWVLSYGPGAEVLEPPELRTKVYELLTQATAQYGQAKKSRRRKDE